MERITGRGTQDLAIPFTSSLFLLSPLGRVALGDLTGHHEALSVLMIIGAAGLWAAVQACEDYKAADYNFVKPCLRYKWNKSYNCDEVGTRMRWELRLRSQLRFRLVCTGEPPPKVCLCGDLTRSGRDLAWF